MPERAEKVALGHARIVWHDRTLWFRTYTVGGYDGYRTLFGRMTPCGELARRMKAPRPERGARRRVTVEFWNTWRKPRRESYANGENALYFGIGRLTWRRLP